MKQHFNITKVLACIWFFWFILASMSNLTNFLSALNIIKPQPFSATNYQLVHAVLARYSWSQSLTTITFICVLLGEFFISFMFLRAIVRQKILSFALLLAITWWGLYLVIDEFFIAYHMENTHGMLLILSIVSWIACQLDKKT